MEANCLPVLFFQFLRQELLKLLGLQSQVSMSQIYIYRLQENRKKNKSNAIKRQCRQTCSTTKNLLKRHDLAPYLVPSGTIYRNRACYEFWVLKSLSGATVRSQLLWRMLCVVLITFMVSRAVKLSVAQVRVHYQ